MPTENWMTMALTTMYRTGQNVDVENTSWIKCWRGSMHLLNSISFPHMMPSGVVFSYIIHIEGWSGANRAGLKVLHLSTLLVCFSLPMVETG